MPVSFRFARLSVGLLLSLTLNAQYEPVLRGRVLDPSGASVPNATVDLFRRDNSLRRATRTDAQGRYEFPRLPPGDYLVSAAATQFRRTPGTAVRVTDSVTADLTLDLLSLAASVTVTATGTAQSTDEVAKALDVIDAAQLERRAEYSILEALRVTPGLRIAQRGGPGSFASIQTRGLRASDTSVLIDGFRLRDAAATQGDASGFLSDLLVVNTDRVEILRGCGSSLYGTNAMAGVINIVTDQGGGPVRGDLLVEGGGLGLFRGVAKASGGLREDRLKWSGGVAHLNLTEGVDGDDRTRNSSAQGFAEYRLTPGVSLIGRLFASDTFLQLNLSPASTGTLPATGLVTAIAPSEAQVRNRERGLPFDFTGATFIPGLNDPDSHRLGRFVSGLVALRHQVAPGVSYRLSYQGLTTRRDNPNGPGGVGFQPAFREANLFEGRLDTAQARADWQLGRTHLITGGYEFEREEFDNTSRNRTAVDTVLGRTQIDQRSHAVFVQDQVRLLNDRLQVSLSGRYQSFGLNRPRFSGDVPNYQNVALADPRHALTGDVAVAYFLPRTGTKLRAHAGNSFRAPSLYERFGAGFFGGRFTPYGDPRLAPERAVALDFGFDQYFGSRVRASGTYFYSRLQSVIGFDFTGAINRLTDPFQRGSGYFNTNGALARGVELSVQANPTRRLTLWSSYTYTNALERNPVVPGTLRSIRVFPHAFTLAATQQFGRRWDATVDFLAASSYVTSIFPRGYLFDGPRKMDLSVRYSIPVSDRRTLRLYTRVENLLNQTYFEEGFRTPKAWAVGGLQVVF